MFVCMTSGVEWVVTTPPNYRTRLRKYATDLTYIPNIPYACSADCDVSAVVRDMTGTHMYSLWLELDNLLKKLWESHSIHLKVVYQCAPPGTHSRVEHSVARADEERSNELIEELDE